ncbi:methionyl-tRNA formyltransferase [Candidatus Parcubacteria bacterium]|nr:MAG: methionyl-tRNA formyltransferase [Candidatus Parcubacteria bacterium]
MTNKIKTIFIGTPRIAVPSFEKLVFSDYFEVLAVITQKDKKVGRKQEISLSEVKKRALEHNIDVLQPEKIKDIKNDILNLKPDIVVVMAYGQIIPKDILDIPKYGFVNIHTSLLPEYRGASCIQSAILNQDEVTGVTFMQMDEGMDTGPIIAQKELRINNNDYEELVIRLADLSAQNIEEVLCLYVKGELLPKKQNDNLATYTTIIKKQAGKIDFNMNSEKVLAMYRAYKKWPGIYIEKANKNIKLIELGNETDKGKKKAGDLYKKNEQLFLMLNDTAVEIKKIQVSGKKVIEAKNFIQGYSYLLS